MKLYATVSSERATKGQGGNWLDIDVFDSIGFKIARIEVRVSESEPDMHEISLSGLQATYLVLEGEEVKTKGNKQEHEMSIEEAECLGCVPGTSKCEEHTK